MPLNLGLEDQLAQSPRRIAYERLLLDLIDGDPTLFVRRDEVDAQREWVVAIRNGWKAHSIRLRIPMIPAGQKPDRFA